MNKKLLSTGALLIALVLFLALNIAANALFKSARLDLTDNGLYTLSEGTRNILRNLDEPITLRFFLSQKLASGLPGINTYAIRVKELLEEYQRVAGDKLNLLIIEPESFSEAEDQAVGYGLQGVALDSANTAFYFGLAGSNAVGDEEIIAFFQPSREEFLEYDLTKLVHQLAHPKQKVIGLLSSLPIMGDKPAMPFLKSAGGEAWMVIEQLRQSFALREIEARAASIPAEVDVLMIVHPKNLSDTTLYAIDQFVLRGGRAIVFADPYAEADEPPALDNNPLAGLNAPRNSDLGKLFDAWGIKLEPNKVVGELDAAQRVQSQKGGRMVVLDYPVWLGLDEKHLNQGEVITAKLGNLNFASAGALSKQDGAEIGFIPLVESGERAMLIDTAKLGLLSDPESLVKDFKPEQKYTLAARVTGSLKSAFPDGKPKAEDPPEEEQPATEHLAESKEPVNLIVVADTDLLQDRFWVQVQNFLGNRIAIPTAANATLVSNALDNLSGSNDLISVRNRGSFTRPFTQVEQIQLEAGQRFRQKEEELQARLSATEDKLRELQNQKGDAGGLVLSTEQQQALLQFRDEKVKIRKELRNVQHELQKDIERLESRLKFVNIALIPLLVGFGGIVLGIYRLRRRRGGWQAA
jgi:ABC-type uncharacterized transport system involved in gliding motility auxiliary subunit